MLPLLRAARQHAAPASCAGSIFSLGRSYRLIDWQHTRFVSWWPTMVLYRVLPFSPFLLRSNVVVALLWFEVPELVVDGRIVVLIVARWCDSRFLDPWSVASSWLWLATIACCLVGFFLLEFVADFVPWLFADWLVGYLVLQSLFH